MSAWRWHMECDVRTPNLRLEPRMYVSSNVQTLRKCDVWGVLFTIPVGCSRLLSAINDLTTTKKILQSVTSEQLCEETAQRVSPFYMLLFHEVSNSSISVRLCWWASRNSNFCRHNCPCRSRRSSSAWAAWRDAQKCSKRCLDYSKEGILSIALLELFRTTRITLHCPCHESSLSIRRWMGCRHYFVADRLEALVDEGDSRSSARAHEHDVAIQTP